MRYIRNCNVAVIGGAGFLGSHLVRHLRYDRDCRVVILDNLITGRREFIPQDPQIKFIWTDITHSETSLKKLFLSEKIDYVFNYAAEPYIPISFDRPLHVFDINARGAMLALNAAHEAGVKGFLQVSSAEIYGDVGGKIKEDDPVTPHSTYGASKVAIDYYLQARHKECGLKAIALRQFNCVGERETHPYIIPEIIHQLKSSNSGIVFLGNDSERDFIYAGDAVRLAVELLEFGEFGEVYNLGSEEVITMYKLAEMIGEIMLGEKIIITPEESRKRPWEIWHLQSDNTKIYTTIPSRPKVCLEDSISRVIEDYDANGGYFFYDTCLRT